MDRAAQAERALGNEIDRLLAQRTQLLEALEAMVALVTVKPLHGDTLEVRYSQSAKEVVLALEQARAAIQAVREG